MESVSASRAWLAEQHIFIAVPAYGNQIAGNFMISLAQLRTKLDELGVKHTLQVLGNESLITRARNSLVNSFLHSDATYLLFLDSDLGFRADDILAMLFLQKDVIGLPYAVKGINWERIKRAVEAGVPADRLHLFTPMITFNMLPGVETFAINEPLEVKHIATGLMLIKREVFDKLALAHPEWEYTLMYNEYKSAEYKTQWAFFRIGIEPETNHYLSEDYQFCQDWRDLGGKIWTLPWAKTDHVGSYPFECDLSTIADAKVPI